MPSDRSPDSETTSPSSEETTAAEAPTPDDVVRTEVQALAALLRSPADASPDAPDAPDA